ncbi:MAG: translation initiation factor IF-3 [Gammaproteobacteria bacterium]|nr:translation initiation factor IF-3 [Gammaproteobacteria bacterium]
MKKGKRARVNQQIQAPQVRLIDSEGNQVGIVPINEALSQALADKLDLVEIAPNAKPPVCKIMDYRKHLFQQQKLQTEARKKQRRTQTKKLRISLNIEEGDYQVKLRNLIRFLEKGDRAEVSLRLQGREIIHKDLAIALLNRIKNDLADYADVDREPVPTDRVLVMGLTPKKKK